MAFTDFPGLIIRYGEGYVAAYPRCGCDACDEDVEQLMAEIDDQFDAVAEGRYREVVRRRQRSYVFGERVISERLLSSMPRKERGPRQWGPWRRRAGSTNR